MNNNQEKPVLGTKYLVLNVFWILLGLVLIVLSALNILDSSVYSGMGGALIGVGAVRLVQLVRYQNNAEYRENVNTKRNDERNRFLSMKSMATAAYIMAMVDAVGSLVAMWMEEPVIQQVLLLSLAALAGIYWVVYIVLSKKY